MLTRPLLHPHGATSNPHAEGLQITRARVVDLLRSSGLDVNGQPTITHISLAVEPN